MICLVESGRMKGDFNLMIGVSFMQNDKSLISFALISSSWQTSKKDYLDMLSPFILYYCSELSNDSRGQQVSITDAKLYINNEFGIKILSNVIELVFKRLCKKPYDYLYQNNQKFLLSGKHIDISNFKKERESIGLSQQFVLNYFYKFLDDKNINYDINTANKMLIAYLCRYGKEVISDRPIILETGDIWNYRVGKFVQFSYETNEQIFEYIKNIAKGGMISSIIFYKESSNYSSTFRNTEIYYDTPLLLHILGYSGPALQETVIEMTKLLQNNGAKICYFEHNQDELEGILKAYINRYNTCTLAQSYNFDYFIEKNVKPEKVIEYIALIDANLAKYKLAKKSTPEFGYINRNIDWIAFDAYIARNIKYVNPNRRKNDVESLAAIYRLRKHEKYTKYESCEALFVATNSSLVFHSQHYFHYDEEKNGVPAIVDDTFLTGLVWLKSVDSDDQLPTLKIISDALASQSLSTEFWGLFVEKIQEFENQNLITPEQANNLRVDIFTRKNVYDVTDGNIEKVTHESMVEILKMNERERFRDLYKNNEEISLENHLKEQKISNLSSELIKEKAQKYLSGISIWKLFIILGKSWLLFLCILVVLTSSLLEIIFSLNSLFFKSTTIISFIIAVVSKVIDKQLSSYTSKIKNWFYKKSYRILTNRIEKFDPEYKQDILIYLTDKIDKFHNI